ncbi:oligosaccharide repeat unit polymerase [Vibrio diazotrophicus]|uniref:oligosaccharide repeat unit polymerase n=1 Tax=Vibrio diazotrophicus TaxID=685 RepID=UPI000C9E1058|nr:oligosaccharide repeat unit polymerase [Vibrio diazotrophicus]PNH80582.1 hypothetical protein C1N27_09155 [Vibrio diazotrophicus]
MNYLTRKQNKLIERVSITSIATLWLSNTIDPLGFIGIKYLSMFLLFLGFIVAAFCSFERLSRFEKIFFLFFVAYIPFYGLIRMLIASNGNIFRFNDTSYVISSFFYIFTILIFSEKIYKYNVRFMNISLYCLSVLTCVLYIVPIVGLQLNDVVMFLQKSGLVYISTRTYGGVTTPYIYFIISPMLIMLLSKSVWDFLNRKSVINLYLITFILFSLLLSGTRMNLIMAFMSIAITYVYYRSHKLTRSSIFTFTILAFSFLLLSAFLYYNFNDYVNSALSMNDVSNSKKINDLFLMSEIFNQPSVLLFGQGFNAYDWSPLTRELIDVDATKIELTLFEFIRVFGLLNTLIFAALIVFSLFKKNLFFHELGWCKPALVSYLLVSFFNPYFFSLNGMLVFGTCLSPIFLSESLKEHNIKYGQK